MKMKARLLGDRHDIKRTIVQPFIKIWCSFGFPWHTYNREICETLIREVSNLKFASMKNVSSNQQNDIIKNYAEKRRQEILNAL